jgi:hypothetical protein
MTQNYREVTTSPRKALFDYSEQHVLFDTPSYFIDDVSGHYGNSIIDSDNREVCTNYCVTLFFTSFILLLFFLIAFYNFILKFYILQCEYFDDLFKKLRMYPNVSAAGLGCVSKDGDIFPRRYHLYGCMQFPKKMHPRFDEVFHSILVLDKDAKFLLMDGARSIIPRLKYSLDIKDPEKIFEHFVFVPRSEHGDYLQLLSLLSVFLNTFPFGSGITSSEALSLCIPVIVAPGLNSVLPLAMHQVHMLGEDLKEHLFAYNVSSFAVKSFNVAFGNMIPLRRLKQIICDRKDRLFGGKVLKNITWEWMSFLAGLSEATL